MKKRNAQPISELLSDFLDGNSGLKVKLAERRAVKAWQEVLGEGVLKYTRNVYFKRNVLYVHLSSAVLRAELIMNKEGLIEKINAYAGLPVVRDILIR